MRRPVWVALGAILAAGVSVHVSLSVGVLVVAAGIAIAFAATTAHAGRRRGLAMACIAAALVFGRAAISVALVPLAPDAIQPGPPVSGWEHEAVVLSVSAPSDGTQRVILELLPPEAAERVWASLPRYPTVAPTDMIRFGGALEAAPEEGGFAEFLARTGIGWTTRARALERLGGDGSPLAELEHLRRGAATAISATLPEPQAGLASAMSIGLRDLVARDVAADFRTAGLSHVVAISGWHIAMLGAVVGGLLGGLGRRPRTIIVLLAIGAYAVFAGASPSVLRATVMAAVVLLARESGRSGSAAAALSLTVAGMLLLDPETITDIGFQLSAAATGGLLMWGTRAREWVEKRLPRRTPAWLLESLGVSLAAQAATLPLVLLHFGTLSLVSPLANLLIAPLVAPAMLLTGVAFVCGLLVGAGIPMLLIAPVALVGGLVVGAMIAIAHVCASLPFASVVLVEPLNIAAAAVCSLALLRYLRPRSTREPPAAGDAQPGRDRSPATSRGRSQRLVAVGAAAAAAILIVAASGARPDGRLHVTVLDVGQGDAILLQGPNGGRALLDTGPDPDRLISLLDARIPAWDRRLDLVVLTHPHEDHVAGLAAVLDRYRIGEIVEPGMVGPGPGDAAYRRRLAELGRQSRVVAAGDQLWLDGVRLNVAWPQRGTVPLRAPDRGTGINNVSIVLDVHFGSHRMIFAGDVEQEIDPQLLAAGLAGENGQPLDVLKVAHHGSRTATTDAFVERMKPRLAVVSTGWGNPYGHPSPQTVARLAANGARVFRTDVDGSVEITTDGDNLVANVSGARTDRPRRSPTPPPGIGFCPVPQSPPVTGRGRRRTYNRVRCPSPLGLRRHGSYSASSRTIGSPSTAPLSPTSPLFSPVRSRRRVTPSTFRWSRLRRSCTTSTRRCRRPMR